MRLPFTGFLPNFFGKCTENSNSCASKRNRDKRVTLLDSGDELDVSEDAILQEQKRLLAGGNPSLDKRDTSQYPGFFEILSQAKAEYIRPIEKIATDALKDRNNWALPKDESRDAPSESYSDLLLKIT